MPNLTVYYPDADERDAAKDELVAIATRHGYYTVYETQERGSIRKLIGAIIGGEMTLLLMAPEQQYIALEQLERLLPTLGVIERSAIEALASALRDSIKRMEP